MSYVDPDKLGDLMHRDTLKAYLLAGVFVPQIVQLIYAGMQSFLDYNLDELALIKSPLLFEHYRIAENENSPKNMGRKVLNALNELLAHYGLHIAAPPYTLTYEQALTLDHYYGCDAGSFEWGYFKGYMAAVHTTEEELIQHARMVAATPPRERKK